jgi:feruloyl esterase
MQVRRNSKGIVAGLAIALALGSAAAARGAVYQPVRACDSLASLDPSRVDAQVETAADSTQNGVLFCEVTGYTSPQTHFTVLLPQRTWEGDYLQQGCGGLCGHNDVSLTDPSRTSLHQGPFAPRTDGELVVAADDQGHEGPGALWAKEDPIVRVVFGYRSEHDLARAAKAIIGAYYGRTPAHSYFDGVSDGGHEALAVAQRYPRDFDGILAGAPANNWAALGAMSRPGCCGPTWTRPGIRSSTARSCRPCTPPSCGRARTPTASSGIPAPARSTRPASAAPPGPTVPTA